MAEFSPVLPMIGSGKSKFQPVYVGDVAEAILKIVELEENNQNIFVSFLTEPKWQDTVTMLFIAILETL